MARDYKPLPHASELWELFDYKPLTGELVWRVKQSNTVPEGAVAGSKHPSGYIHLKMHRGRFRAHRAVYAWVYGACPEGKLDHADRDRSNNRIWNLRPASDFDSARNAKKPPNRHGYRGVSQPNGQGGRYTAAIRTEGRRLNLGTYSTPEEAGAAYAKAAAELHGEFACVE